MTPSQDTCTQTITFAATDAPTSRTGAAILQTDQACSLRDCCVKLSLSESDP